MKLFTSRFTPRRVMATMTSAKMLKELVPQHRLDVRPHQLKDWAFAIAKRSTMRKARVALARRLAIIMHAMLRDGTEFASA